MHYKLLYQNINDLFCRLTIAAWTNLKAQDDSLCLHDDLIGMNIASRDFLIFPMT